MSGLEDAWLEERKRQFHPLVPEGGWPTTLCTRSSLMSEAVGAPCPECGHTSYLHPNIGNPALTECVICRVLGYPPVVSEAPEIVGGPSGG